MSRVDPASLSRRSFLRAVGIGTIIGGASMVWLEAFLAGECFGNGQCKVCPSFKGCELPLRKDYEARLQPQPATSPVAPPEVKTPEEERA